MAHGSDAIHELIEDTGWSYPVTVNRLEREYALKNIKLDEDGKYMIMMTELFLNAELDRFESRADLDRKLEPVIEAEINSRKVGYFTRLKQAFFGH